MNWGMITYQVPLERFPDTYNGRPLMYAALASQQRHMALYLTAVYADAPTRDRFLEAYRATGKRLDAGRSCVRFRRLDDLALDAVAEAVGTFGVDEFLAIATRARRAHGRGAGE